MACNFNDCLVKAGLRRITAKNLLFFYYPLKGATCYVAFAAHTMNPLILSSHVLFPRWLPVASLALLHSNLGLAAYLFNSRHLKQQHICTKITYSVFDSIMLNMGTILSMAMLRQWLPDCVFIRTLAGVGVSSALLFLGHRYVKLLDQQALAQHSANIE